MKQLTLLILALMFLLTGCGEPTFIVQMVSGQPGLEETVLRFESDNRFWDRGKVAIIDVDGLMTNSSEQGLLAQSENPVSLFTEKLHAAESDSDVRAVILRLNSPGGTVAASDLMYHELLAFRQRSGKPVIACMLDMAASGGYYLACGADGIIAQPSTITGSIGTIMQTVSFAGTMDKIGITAEAITSGQLKDLASPLHDLRDDEREILHDIIMQMYGSFCDVVLAGRPNLTAGQLETLADGRVFTAHDALEAGLIDRIGYTSQAIAWAKQMASLERADVIIYHRPLGYASTVYAGNSNVDPQAALVNIELPNWLKTPGTQFLYLYQPGLN